MTWDALRLLDQTTLATTGRMGTMGSNDTQREVRGTTRKPIMDGMKPWGAKSKDKAHYHRSTPTNWSQSFGSTGFMRSPMLPSPFQIDLPFCMLSCYTTCRIDPVSSETAGIYDILSSHSTIAKPFRNEFLHIPWSNLRSGGVRAQHILADFLQALEIVQHLARFFATNWRWGTKPPTRLAAGCDATIRPSSAGNLNLKLGAPRSSVNGTESVRRAKLQDSRALACVARDMRGAVPPLGGKTGIISLVSIHGTSSGSVTSPVAALDGWLHGGWNAMTGTSRNKPVCLWVRLGARQANAQMAQMGKLHPAFLYPPFNHSQRRHGTKQREEAGRQPPRPFAKESHEQLRRSGSASAPLGERLCCGTFDIGIEATAPDRNGRKGAAWVAGSRELRNHWLSEVFMLLRLG
ncbi:hypothetical protein AK812_SmicGene31365 [Symbiodinium microadriaticum]|uniref:Uncharacterized protein n=1 Tax=Symbiodinium microadriaticum TaxID=2951 RepID=A0A1Q9CWX4_SYMMI|nr:hypothetical protein AK812_SmicGene31365 [Symbiodinium microadriaticum]